MSSRSIVWVADHIHVITTTLTKKADMDLSHVVICNTRNLPYYRHANSNRHIKLRISCISLTWSLNNKKIIAKKEKKRERSVEAHSTIALHLVEASDPGWFAVSQPSHCPV